MAKRCSKVPYPSGKAAMASKRAHNKRGRLLRAYKCPKCNRFHLGNTPATRAVGSSISKAIKQSWETDYYDVGTIEGRLEAIQDASGALKIRVQDYLFAKPINCFVPEDMIELVFSSFRKRVEITGKIHYRRGGAPISIKAFDIEILPEDDELPEASDVRGVFAA